MEEGTGVQLESWKANHYGDYGKVLLSDQKVHYIKVFHNYLPGYNPRKFRPVVSS